MLRVNAKQLNKCMYLPKMLPLKWVCRGVWGILGIRAMWGGVWYERGEREGNSTWEYLPMKLCRPPTIIVGGDLAHVRGGKAGLFELESWCVL